MYFSVFLEIATINNPISSMTIKIPSQRKFRFTNWFRAGSIHNRLNFLFPPDTKLKPTIKTYELSGNAEFVNYVRHHIVTNQSTNDKIELIEKSIKKIFFIPSAESRFYRERSIFAQCKKFRHPRCYGIIETPFESIIFTRFINGHPPRMAKAHTKIAHGIAEIELIGNSYLSSNKNRSITRKISLDFFNPWYFYRPKYNYKKLLRRLYKITPTDMYINLDSTGIIKQLSQTLSLLKKSAVRSPRCFSHLDYLRKNLIETKHELFLIDWSEVKIGRIGFDAGAYLSNLYRNLPIPEFLRIKRNFLDSYYEAIHTYHDKESIPDNILYIFLHHSLWYFLRDSTLSFFFETGQPQDFTQKISFLTQLSSVDFSPTKTQKSIDK